MSASTIELYKKPSSIRMIREEDDSAVNLVMTFVVPDENSPMAAVEIVASQLKGDQPKLMMQLVPRNADHLRNKFIEALPDSIQKMLDTRRQNQGDVSEGISDEAKAQKGMNLPADSISDMLSPADNLSADSSRFVKAGTKTTSHHEEMDSWRIDALDEGNARRPANQVMAGFIGDLAEKGLMSQSIALKAKSFLDEVGKGMVDKPVAIQKQICRTIAEPERGQGSSMSMGA